MDQIGESSTHQCVGALSVSIQSPQGQGHSYMLWDGQHCSGSLHGLTRTLQVRFYWQSENLSPSCRCQRLTFRTSEQMGGRSLPIPGFLHRVNPRKGTMPGTLLQLGYSTKFASEKSAQLDTFLMRTDTSNSGRGSKCTPQRLEQMDVHLPVPSTMCSTGILLKAITKPHAFQG